MGLGWFDAIAGAAMPIATGFQTGRLQAEEEQWKRAEEAMRQSLLQAQIDYYGRGRDEYHPATMDEAIKYELGIHPERTARPEGFNQSDWVKAGFPDTPEGQQQYLDYVGKRARTEYPERFRPPSETSSGRVAQDEEASGLGILDRYMKRGARRNDPQGLAQVGAFSSAFQAIRNRNPEMTPGRVATQALKSMRATQPELFRAPDDDGTISVGGVRVNLGGDPGEEVVPVPAAAPIPAQPAIPAPIAAPTAPAPPSPTNPSGKRPVTQDQADYLRATGQWNDALFEVMQ